MSLVCVCVVTAGYNYNVYFINFFNQELQKRLHREVGATLPEQNEAELSQLKPMKQSLEDDLVCLSIH